MPADPIPSLARRPSGPAEASLFGRLLATLPRGRQLTERVWSRRHRAIVLVATFQSIGVLGFGLYRRVGLAHALLEAGLVAATAGLAWWSRSGPVLRSAYSTMALLIASAVFVHQAGGTTEWHFHFFVMVGLITLYQEWVPFVVAIVFVVLHHGVMGGIDPEGVFGTPAAIKAPLRWAVGHGAFVLAAAAVHIAAWRMSEEQGVTDPLTGLPNRAGFTDLVDHQIERTPSVAVLFLDLDGFKRINDALGHDAGDEVLQRVGARVREVLRPGDLAARLGGDEFAIVVPGPETAGARRIADRLLQAVAQPIYLKSHQREVHLRASIGIAVSTPRIGGAELVRRADIAMYSAKSQGGGRSELFDSSLDAVQQERAEFADDLRAAVQEGQLRLVYQPVVDLESGGIQGVEALMRWEHPTRGAVSPARFIPVAEETGLIVGMGEWALDTALDQLAAWTDEKMTELSMAVNVSIRQLDEPAFGERVLARLDRLGIAPHRLVLELTESMLVVDLDQTAARLGELRRHGVRVAIDDFGTGYSSMSYLSRLPVDVVKIDQSFVQRLVTSATEAALVRSIIELASNLHLDIVAEGVEHASQAHALRDLHCSTGQGYLWRRPVAPERIPELFEARVPVAGS